ncbi:MAG TPA: heavy metal-binding domain-containing protein, partial [Tepidisphaeraceae bacterium]
MAKAKSSIPRSVTADPPADRWAILTQIAFLLSLMLVVARATMLEAGGEPAPGPRQAGPATSLMLDLLCCLPMLLVLARRMLDPTYVLRGSVSLVLSAGLAGWMLFSGIWASDRYTAVVSAAHFAAGMALLASTVQLVRSWQRLRIIAAVMFGLLAYLTAFGAYYKLVEAPDLQHEWTKWYCPVHTHEISTFPRSCPVCGREMVQTRLEEFKRHNWARDSFSAQQFEKKIMGGEVMGFSASPNTYGAVLALLITIGLGLIVQRVVEMRRGEGAGFDYSRFDYSIVFLATALIPAGVMIYFTGSKAAGIAPVLGAGVLAVIGRMRGALAARARARA